MQVHIIIGVGSLTDLENGGRFGTLADFGGTANDPTFISLHCMVDYIFEEWLQRQDNPSYQGPSSSLFAGHAAEDCAMGFIPIYTAPDVFKTADHFGYYYAPFQSANDSLTMPTSDSDTSDSGNESNSGFVLESFPLVTIIALLSSMVAMFHF